VGCRSGVGTGVEVAGAADGGAGSVGGAVGPVGAADGDAPDVHAAANRTAIRATAIVRRMARRVPAPV
jgi:hypothetical protein